MVVLKSTVCILYLITSCCSEYSYKSRPTLILERMKSDEALCVFPSKDLYSSKLLTVCDRPLTDHTQIKEQLKYDLLPLLCMALYDVSIRLCELTKQHHELEDTIPKTEKDFTTLLAELEKSNQFSSLDYFCSPTVYNSLIDRTNVSYETANWINYFNQALRDVQQCKRVCLSGLSEPNKVHPLCSFILWSNYLYFQNAASELSAKDQPSKATEENKNESAALQPSLVKPNVKKPEEEESKLKTDAYYQNSTTVYSTYTPSVSVNSKSKNNPDKESDRAGEKLEKVEKQTENVQKDSVVDQNDKTVLPSQGNQNTYSGSDVDHKGNNLSKNVKIDNEKNKPNSPTKNKPDLPTDQKPLSPDKAQTSALGPAATIPSQPEPQKPEQEEDKVAPPVIEPIENDNLEDVNDIIPINDDTGDRQEPPSYQEEDGDTDKENKLPNPVMKEQTTERNDFIVKDYHVIEAEDSHFFTNFVSLSVLCIIAYLVFHNKKKLLALAVEGKRRGPTRRRPNTASYSKLDCNLEEAMVSNTTASVTHVLY